MERDAARRLRTDRAILAIAILAVALGAFARFAFLDRPLFFKDEAITALFTTGHSVESYVALFDGSVHPASDIVAVTTVEPRRGPIAAARAIEAQDPHHAPLFFMLERVWVGFAGSSVDGFRSFAAVLGMLGIALAYVLIRLLSNRRAARMGAALFALSPLFVALSREAREYTCFVDAALVASIVLVVALRRRTLPIWIVYALCLALGMYVDVLFVLVAAAHGAFVFFTARSMPRVLAAWAVSAATGVATFAPWAINAMHSTRSTSELDWARTSYSPKYAALKWIFNLGALGFDGEFKSLRFGFAGVASAIVVVAAFAYLTVAIRDRRRTLCAALAGITIVAFALLDLVQHAHFSTIARYLSEAWIGIELGVTFALAELVESRRMPYVRAGYGAWIVLLVLGGAAFAIRGPAENWWQNTDDIAYQAVARTIASDPQALVVIQDRDQVALELARYLEPNRRVLLVPAGDRYPAIGGPAFLVTPTAGLREHLRLAGMPAANVSPAAPATARGAPADGAGPADGVRAANALWFARGTLAEVRDDRP